MTILSPNDSPTGLPVNWDTSAACVKLRMAPNVDLIEPGDIILFAPIKPALHQKGIISAQKGLPSNSVRWTHAAIAFDRNRIVEAVVKGGVMCGNLFDSCGDHYIKIRRPVGLDKVERMRFAMEALSNISTKYSLLYAAKIGLSRKLPNIFPDNLFPREKDVVCSQFISNAFVKAANSKLIEDRLFNVTPAHIDSTNVLQDVSIGWRPLVQ